MTTVHAQHTEQRIRSVSISGEASSYADRSKVIPLFRRVATFEEAERWCEADPAFVRKVKEENGIWIDPNPKWSYWPDPIIIKYKSLGTGESVLDFYPVRGRGSETMLRKVAYISDPELVGEVRLKPEEVMHTETRSGGRWLEESLSEMDLLKLANS